MKIFSKSILAATALLMGICLASCSDANEYEDVDTDNPSFGVNGTVSHPESLSNTKYVRAQGIKYNALGQEIQGFVESIEFVTEDSVKVTMSQGVTEGTWIDESNDQFQPHYYYTYNSQTGNIEIKKRVIDDKGAVSLPTIFMGTAITGTKELITIVHFGDTPAQTYLVKQ
ncbi:MAG: hypothetical protein K2H97_04755 [Prevotella sp.]|nr:hypothetical protein [Prevotella sp.]